MYTVCIIVVVGCILVVFKAEQQQSQEPLAVEKLSSHSHCPSFLTLMLLSMLVVVKEEMKCQKY